MILEKNKKNPSLKQSFKQKEVPIRIRDRLHFVLDDFIYRTLPSLIIKINKIYNRRFIPIAKSFRCYILQLLSNKQADVRTYTPYLIGLILFFLCYNQTFLFQLFLP